MNVGFGTIDKKWWSILWNDYVKLTTVPQQEQSSYMTSSVRELISGILAIMENLFEQKLEGFETYKWISVDDCSEELGVVEEPSFSTSKMVRLKESNGRIRD